MKVVVEDHVSYVPHEDGTQGVLLDGRNQHLIVLNGRARQAWECFAARDWDNILRKYTIAMPAVSKRRSARELRRFADRCVAQGWVHLER